MNDTERNACIRDIQVINRTLDKVSVTSHTPEQLIRQEAVLTLDAIRSCFASNTGAALDAALKVVLSQRWDRIKGSSLCYTEQPEAPVNKLCLRIARALSSPITTQKELDALSEREGPYFLLMPTLQSGVDISGDNIHALRLDEFIISDDARAVIPITAVLEKAAVSNEFEFQNVVGIDGQYAQLTDNERNRIAHHATATAEYLEAILALHRAKQGDGGLGAHLNQLIIALRRGGKHGGGDGQENNAGADANVGILLFSEYWNALPKTTRDAHCQKYPSLKQALDRLLVPLNPDYKEMYCVEITADILDGFVPSLWRGLSDLQKNLDAKKEAYHDRVQKAHVLQRKPHGLANTVPGYFKSDQEKSRYIRAFEPSNLSTETLSADIKNETFGNNLDTALTMLVSLGHIDAARHVLASDVDISVRNKQGKNAIDIALEKKSVDLMEHLLLEAVKLPSEAQMEFLSHVSHGKYGDVLSYAFNQYPLLYIKLMKQIQTIHPLHVFTDAELNPQDSYGQTLLILAVRRGDVNQVRYLLALGADVKLKAKGNTALHLAAYDGHWEMIDILLKNGFEKVDELNTHGNTALQLAIVNGHNTTAAALLAAGADICLRILKTNNALDMAIIRSPSLIEPLLLKAVTFDYPKQKEFLSKISGGPYENVLSYAFHAHPQLYVKLLKEKKTKEPTHVFTSEELNCKDSKGDTPLIIAIRRRDLEAVGYLLSLGVDIDIENKTKYRAMEYGIFSEEPEVVRLLLKQAPRMLNQENALGGTALRYAVYAGKSRTVSVLLEYGADLLLRNSETGNNALDLAIVHSPSLIEPLLLKALILNLLEQKKLLSKISEGPYENVLSYAKEKHPLLYWKLLKQSDHSTLTKEQLNPINAAGESVLLQCVKRNDVESVRELLALNVNSGEHQVALEEALQNGSDEVVNCLLKTIEPNTTFQLAVMYGRSAIVDFLLHQKASIMLFRNNEGENALDLAIQKGHSTCIESLLLNALKSTPAEQKEMLSAVDNGQYTCVSGYIQMNPNPRIEAQLEKNRLKALMKDTLNKSESLRLAATLGDEITVQRLLKEKYSPQEYHSAFDIAVNGGHHKVIKAILLKAAQLSEADQRIVLGGTYENVLIYVAMEQPVLFDEFLSTALYDKKIAHVQSVTRVLDDMRFDIHIQGFQEQLNIMIKKSQDNAEYPVAVAAARTLIKESIQAKITFLLDDDLNTTFDEKKATYKTSLLGAVDSSREVLKTHREWGKRIAAFVLTVVCLPVAVGLYSKGFFKTKSEQMLEKYSADVNKKPSM